MNETSAFRPIPNPFDRFCAIFAALNKDRRFFQSPTALRFASLAAVSCPGEPEEVANGVRELAEELLEETKWFGALKSDIRFIVAAMLLLHGDRGQPLLDEIERVRKMFREADLRRAGSSFESIAILILRLQRGGAPITDDTIARFGAIYEEMKTHHWWLTGPDDFPACALLTASTDQDPVQIGERSEAIYQALTAQGFSKGDPLQTAANILFLAGVDPDELARRYRALADRFSDAGVSIWQSDYDELAILSFLDHDAAEIVRRVVECRAKFDALKPKVDRFTSFNLAVSIVFLEMVQLDKEMRLVSDVKSITDLQAVISAQQAATMAAVTAGVSASTAATAGS